LTLQEVQQLIVREIIIVIVIKLLGAVILKIFFDLEFYQDKPMFGNAEAKAIKKNEIIFKNE